MMASAAAQYRVIGLQVNQQQSITEIIISHLFVSPDIQIDNIRYRCHNPIEVYPQHHCQQADLRFKLQQNQLQLSGRVDYDVVKQILKINAMDQDNTMVFNYDSGRQSPRTEPTAGPVNKG